jgi:hypothetical protein
MVIVGEEIATPRYHLLAIGIHDNFAVRYASPAGAFARSRAGRGDCAHLYELLAAYDQESLALLDGAEIVRRKRSSTPKPRPICRRSRAAAPSPRSDRRTLTAWDRRVLPHLHSRAGAASKLSSTRSANSTRRIDRDRFYGEPEFVELAIKADLPRTIPDLPAPGFLRWFSRIAAILALAAAVLLGRRV